jgi:hypothetical protein
MQAMAITEGPYAPADQFNIWATLAYNDTWLLHLQNHPIQALEPELATVVSFWFVTLFVAYDLIPQQQMAGRSSNFRSQLKDRLQPVIRYGYGFKSPVLTSLDEAHNKQLVNLLKSDTFHCRVSLPPCSQPHTYHSLTGS